MIDIPSCKGCANHFPPFPREIHRGMRLFGVSTILLTPMWCTQPQQGLQELARPSHVLWGLPQ